MGLGRKVLRVLVKALEWGEIWVRREEEIGEDSPPIHPVKEHAAEF